MKPEQKAAPSDADEKASTAADDEVSHAEASHTVATEDDSHVDDERSMATAPEDDDEDEEDDDEKVKSTPTKADEDASTKADTPTSAADDTPTSQKKQNTTPTSVRRGRAPAVKGLTIPFRTVKKVGTGGYGIYMMRLNSGAFLDTSHHLIRSPCFRRL